MRRNLLGMWYSSPASYDSLLDDAQDQSPPVSPRAPLSASAPAILARSKDPYQKAEDMNMLVHAVGCKMLKYFNIAPPANSPDKRVSEERKIARERMSLAHVVSTKLEPSQRQVYAERQNLRLLEIHSTFNRNHGLLMDTARMLKAKFDFMDTPEFARHLRNWGVNLQNEALYQDIKECAVVDIMILIYVRKRFPDYAFSHYDFMMLTLKKAPHSSIDYLVSLEEELAKIFKPLEFYEMEFPVDEEKQRDEMQVTFSAIS